MLPTIRRLTLTRVFLALVALMLLSGLIFTQTIIKAGPITDAVCEGNDLRVSWSGLNTPVTVTVNSTLVVPNGASAGSTLITGPGDWTVHIEQRGDPTADYTTSCPGPQIPTRDPRLFPGGNPASVNVAYRLSDGGFELYTYNPFLRIGIFRFRMTCADERAVATTSERLHIAGQSGNIPVYQSVDYSGHAISVYFVYPDQIQINGYFSDGKPHTFSFKACVDARTIDLNPPTKTPTPTPTFTPTGVLPRYSVSASCTARGSATFIITNTGGPMDSNGTWQITLNNQLVGSDVFRLRAGASFTVSSSGLYGTLTITASGAGAESQTASTFCNAPTATPTATLTNTPVPPRYSVSASCTARGNATFIITNSGGPMPSNGTWQITLNNQLVGSDVFRLRAGASFTVSSSGLYGTLTIIASGAGAESQTASTFCNAPTATPTPTPR